MKKTPIEVRNKLKRLDADTIMGLDKARKDLMVADSLKRVVRSLIEEEQDYVLRLDSADEALAVKHANSKGRLAMATTLVHMIEGSGEELDRRESEQEKK